MNSNPILPSFLFFMLICVFSFAQSDGKNPSFEEVLSLRSAGTPIISPDGKNVVFSIRSTDWKTNGYDSELWLSKDGQPPFQLTNTSEGSSSSPQWTPDGQWITFLAKRGEKTQLYAIRLAGGEALPVSNAKEGINSYEISPDGKRIAFTMSQADDKSDKSRKERYGAYEVDDEEYKLSWLYVMDFQPELRNPNELPCYDEKDAEAQNWECLQYPKVEALIDSVEFTVSGFAWSPDGKKIAVQHQPDPLINSFFNADISILNVESKELKLTVSNPSADGFADWSPDSKQILFSSSLENRTSNYYLNGKLFIMDLASGKTRPIVEDFDENINGLEWTPKGIFATAYQKTTRPILRIDPQTGKTMIWAKALRLTYGFTCTPNGTKMAFLSENGDDLPEIYLTTTDRYTPKKVTDMSAQIDNWKVAQSEVVSWKSKDGATIEGILHKPQNYDPDKKYPLLVVPPTLIQHGEFDRRVPIPNAYELLQGLRDVGVPAKLVVYKGFGHGITKPKERLAAIWHNWQWFNQYIWGEEVEIPLGKDK